MNINKFYSKVYDKMPTVSIDLPKGKWACVYIPADEKALMLAQEYVNSHVMNDKDFTDEDVQFRVYEMMLERYKTPVQYLWCDEINAALTKKGYTFRVSGVP